LLKIYRGLFLGVGLIFLVSNIYGGSFGTFPSQIEKQSSDLKLEYRIGFINPSSYPVRVTLSSTESKEYNITFPQEEFRIFPGTTKDPSGGGWYHLGNGKYTKIHYKPFQVDVSRYREDNSLSFPITVEAVTVGEEGSEDGSQSKIVQVRNYNYRAEIDPSLRPENKPESDSDSSWRDNFWQEDNSNSQEDFNLEQNKSSNQEQQNINGDQDPETSGNSSTQVGSDSDKSLIDRTTLILITGIIISLSYIIMEV
jgi:hypothetical protein